jgi:hypothetical protein
MLYYMQVFNFREDVSCPLIFLRLYVICLSLSLSENIYTKNLLSQLVVIICNVYVNVQLQGVNPLQFGIEVLFSFLILFRSVILHLLLEGGCVIICHTDRYFNNGSLLHSILNIQSDSKLLSEFPRRINGNTDNNLESLCISGIHKLVGSSDILRQDLSSKWTLCSIPSSLSTILLIKKYFPTQRIYSRWILYVDITKQIFLLLKRSFRFLSANYF